jgi:4-oxalmesaconate hydratase
VIIDCHGHYTTTPAAHLRFRELQLAWFADRRQPRPAVPAIGDDDLRESIEKNQLRLLKERGADLTLFSPRAAGMGHHEADEEVSMEWTRHCNDLIHRVTELFPDHFAGVGQLPQAPGASVAGSIDELRRCVSELGFVGCNLNPDPSGGRWAGPPMTDRAWYPLYEALVELDVPAMIHVSGSCNPNFHGIGAHYINADTSVFMQLVEGDLFKDFPALRFVIPHGGGAVPFHWGRYRGLADRLNRPPLREHVMKNVFFDTCVYHQAGVDLMFRVLDVENILFGSEMVGAVRGIDPETGFHFDDTKRYVEGAAVSDESRRRVYEANARRVYPRLDQRLRARGR